MKHYFYFITLTLTISLTVAAADERTFLNGTQIQFSKEMALDRIMDPVEVRLNQTESRFISRYKKIITAADEKCEMTYVHNAKTRQDNAFKELDSTVRWTVASTSFEDRALNINLKRTDDRTGQDVEMIVRCESIESTIGTPLRTKPTRVAKALSTLGSINVNFFLNNKKATSTQVASETTRDLSPYPYQSFRSYPSDHAYTPRTQYLR